MASDNEPAKQLLPYLQRADELQKHEPLVAYYCRLYAMELGLKIPQSERTKTTNSILISLMKQLEKDKKSLQLGPDDHLHLEGFASSVFAKADKQDRAGKADNNTAKTFYAASIFFEILNQFGKVQPDLEQKQKYAVWKAADIRKAIKEGRKPVPGPPGGEKDLSQTSSGESDPEMSRIDPTRRSAAETGPSSESFDKEDSQNFSNFLPSPPSHLPTSPPSHIPPPSTPHIPPSNIPPSPSYPTDGYPSHNFQRQHSINRAENPTHPQSYNHQPYPQDPQQHAPQNHPPHEPHQHLPQNYPPHDPHQHLPQNYPPHEPSTYSLPNFQSYPSFSESTLPTAPSNVPPPYYQSSDASYTAPPASNATNFASTAHYNSSGTNGKVPVAASTPAQAYQYDSNYQPPPEKIAEAHKAARFAVGALAFDDVFIAVDYLKKSLELLTNPSAASVVEIMKLQCLVKKKKRQMPKNNEEVKQEPLLKNTGNLLTLQEWILASPNRNGCNSKIYPTFEEIDEGLSKKPGDSFSKDELMIMEVDEGDREMEDSSSRSSLDGTTKKRVRFRLPAVADIFILDSPGGYSAM